MESVELYLKLVANRERRGTFRPMLFAGGASEPCDHQIKKWHTIKDINSRWYSLRS